MRKILILSFFVITLNAKYPKHEFSLGFFSVNVPLSDFSDVANPAFGFDVSYRVGVNPFLVFNFMTGYSFFIPRESRNTPDRKEKYSYHLIPFTTGAEYAILGYERTFSPYLRINAGLSNLRTNYTLETYDPVTDTLISSESGSTSSTKFSFGFGIGFYLSLLDFNFSYNSIMTENRSTQYFNFVIRYRIPINE